MSVEKSNTGSHKHRHMAKSFTGCISAVVNDLNSGIKHRSTKIAQTQSEIKVFKVSLYYLFAHFVALLVEAVLRLYGIGGW